MNLPLHSSGQRIDTFASFPDHADKIAVQNTIQPLDNSLITAGLMEDPSRMIARLNKLLESV